MVGPYLMSLRAYFGGNGVFFLGGGGGGCEQCCGSERLLFRSSSWFGSCSGSLIKKNTVICLNWKFFFLFKIVYVWFVSFKFRLFGIIHNFLFTARGSRNKKLLWLLKLTFLISAFKNAIINIFKKSAVLLWPYPSCWVVSSSNVTLSYFLGP